jgi:hypothetical protein
MRGKSGNCMAFILQSVSQRRHEIAIKRSTGNAAMKPLRKFYFIRGRAMRRSIAMFGIARFPRGAVQQ